MHLFATHSRWLLLFLVLSLLSGTAYARQILNGQECTVTRREVIHQSVFVLCENLVISGQINGDVIGAAVRITIDGEINGNVYLVGGELDMLGSIAGDLHFGGLDLHARPLIRQDGKRQPTHFQSVKAITLNSTFEELTFISEGLTNLGYQLILQGESDGEINFWGSALSIEGDVRGNIFANVGDPAAESSQLETLLLPLDFDISLRNPGLVVSETAVITGDLTYYGIAEGSFGSAIDGIITYVPVNLTPPLPTLEQPATLNVYGIAFMRELTTLAVIGALGLFFVPNIFKAPLVNLRSRPFSSFSVGMLAFILSFPITLLMLLISVMLLLLLNIIGLSGVVVALGIVLGLVTFGGASLFYFVAIFAARSIVAVAVGRVAMRLVGFHRDEAALMQLLVGVTLLPIVVSLPLIGWILNAAALFLGLGAVLSFTIAQFRRIRDTEPTAAPAWYAPSPIVTRDRLPMPPAPKIEQAEAPESPPPTPEAPKYTPHVQHGIANLPEGFDMSFFEDDEA